MNSLVFAHIFNNLHFDAFSFNYSLHISRKAFKNVNMSHTDFHMKFQERGRVTKYAISLTWFTHMLWYFTCKLTIYRWYNMGNMRFIDRNLFIYRWGYPNCWWFHWSKKCRVYAVTIFRTGILHEVAGRLECGTIWQVCICLQLKTHVEMIWWAEIFLPANWEWVCRYGNPCRIGCDVEPRPVTKNQDGLAPLFLHLFDLLINLLRELVWHAQWFTIKYLKNG